MIDVLPEPISEISFYRIRPARIDLPCRVLLFSQPLMSKQVAQMSDLGCFHYFLGKLGRNEKDPAISAEHDIARHD